MRTHSLLVGMVLVAASCHDSSGPRATGPALKLIAGFNLTDTVTAKPATALVVEVRDSSGAIPPLGTIVRFTGVPTAGFGVEMFVESLTSTNFDTFFAGVTDAAGRSAVLVQFGTTAGPARIAISVPTIGIEDTARYTVLPGQRFRMTIAPADTPMYVGHTFTLRGRVADRFGNARTDPVVYGASATGVSISGAGVVSASAIGAYTLTATAGTLSGVSGVSVVPEGTMAAISSQTGLRIVSVGLDGSAYHDLVAVENGGIGVGPQWIPGSNKIVYSTLVAGYQQLRTVDASGSVAAFISNPPATMTHQAEPSPSAAASILYFSAYDSRCSSEFYCLHRSGIDGSNPELLGNFIAPFEVTWRPASSPDGSKVAFVTTGTLIKVFDYATKTTSGWSVPGQYPSWSPDGSSIAYVDQSGGFLHVMSAAGTNSRFVTQAQTYVEGPISWSPDSKWLLARNFMGWLDLIEVATGNVLPLANTQGYGSASLK